MPAKFSDETRIANSVYRYLKDINADVIQLVAPGGQAKVSITFLFNGKRRTVFPDLLAIIDDFIFIGEMKPRFSIADKIKLNELRYSSDGLDSIRKVFARYLQKPCDDLPIIFCLIHGDMKSVTDPEIVQLCFDDDGTVFRK
jgi:hypothetical protein